MRPLFLSILFLTVSYGYSQKTELIADGQNKLTVKWNNAVRLTHGDAASSGNQQIHTKYYIKNDVALLWILPGHATINNNDFAGMFFDDIPLYKQGVAIWRYKPWHSWTKPMPMEAASKMPEDDVQFYYWQYTDGTYGAVVPLSGNGFRTTLGSQGKKWGSKSVSYAINNDIDSIPSMAIAFGKDPYELFERIYRTALITMRKGENQRVKKKFPEPFNYIGWCTWNASDNGTNLNEKLLLDAAKSFSDNQFPIGWILIDDGWFQNNGKQLQSYQPNAKQFPNGFKPVVDELKHTYGIKYMGVWHTFNGLWNGIDPASALGRHFAPAMFSWRQKESPGEKDGKLNTYYFIKPDSDSLNAFYDNWHHYLKREGFDFVKVDNQLVVEKMAANNYPIFILSDSMHKALYRSVNKYFNGAIINCMDMTADAYLNFGTSAVARSEEDYFPYRPDEGYNLQHGNAAAHIVQAVYNSIYFGQMVYPDFDIFQSHNPNAKFHAIARAINCGPIYITDNIGEQNFDVLRPLIFSDGRIIRSETPLLPTEDCLFQVQEAKLFKAFSMVRNTGLLGVWNASDTDAVEGTIRAADVNNIKGNDFVLFEHFSGDLKTAERNDRFPVKLSRMGYRLYYVIPVKNGFAAIGLTDKYNAPATISKEEWNRNKVTIELYEGGNFTAYCRKRPSKITLDGQTISDFQFNDQRLTVNISKQTKPVISIYW